MFFPSLLSAAAFVLQQSGGGSGGGGTTPPLDMAGYLSAATNLINSFGLMPVIVATAVISLAMFLLKRARSGSR